MDDCESIRYSMNPEDIINEDMESQEKRIFLSIQFSEKTIGACFYREDNSRIYLIADCEESAPNFETLEMLMKQIEPSALLLSQNCNEALKSKAELLLCKQNDSQSEPKAETVPPTTADAQADGLSKITTMPAKFFTEKFAKDEVMKLNVPMSTSGTDKERFIVLSSIINVTNTNLLRSIGALMKFIESLEHKTGDCLPISGIQHFFPEKRVYVDTTAIESLQVFKTDWHPSNYKCGSVKDGFCVFSKFNRCVSIVGSAVMRKMFRHPLTDVAILNDRFDLLSVLSAPESAQVVENIKCHLKHVFPMHRVVKRMTVGHAPIKDWKNLQRTLTSALLISGLIQSSPETMGKSALLRKFSENSHIESIRKLCEAIDVTIDFRESTRSDLFRVKQGFSERIDSKMEVYKNLPNILTYEFQNDVPLLEGLQVEVAMMEYMPQIGFVVKVKMLAEAANCYIHGFEFRFFSEGLSFYKSQTCLKLDSEIGDLECEIRDEEVGIMYSLQEEVLRCAKDIYDIIDKLAELDCFVAMSEVSNENKYIRPTFYDGNEFNIVGGRHYLQESCVDSFVANDYVTGESKVKIITGANACGKSIYLKQICLISYMAQIGCFVPAESASLPIVDKIFTRIQTVESVSTKVSSFCFDLNQVSIAMRNATSRSLVALDEFGKGTSISQGVSLLAAVINYWTRSENTPHILISTHLLSLPKLLTQSPKIVYETFEVVVEEDKVSYMYKLKNGIAESSFGASVARMVGVPDHIIRRAKFVTESLAAGHKFPPLRDEKYDAYITRCIEVGKRFRELDIGKERDPEKKIKEFIQSLRDSNAHVI